MNFLLKKHVRIDQDLKSGLDKVEEHYRSKLTEYVEETGGVLERAKEISQTADGIKKGSDKLD